jgi:secretion/DNA translocation related TadE-like protein
MTRRLNEQRQSDDQCQSDDQRRIRNSAGVATVWAVGWMLVLVLVGGVGLVLGFAAARQHQVDAAADLIALSAASSLQRDADPCATAARVATANRVVLQRCRVIEEDVAVAVRARVEFPFGLHGWVSGRARAGPG